MKMKKIFKYLVKVVAFVVIFSVLFSYVTTVLSHEIDQMSFNSITSFYKEPKNSLDAVYIGSSNALAYWNPLFAWEEYGITVPLLAGNSQPFAAAEYEVKEAHKRQPNSVILVNINTLGENSKVPQLHRVFAFSPFSFNKVEQINYLGNLFEFNKEKKLELLFPIIKFHNRWDTIDKKSLNVKPNDYRGAITYKPYLQGSINVENKYRYSDELATLTEFYTDPLNRLLDYCDKEKVKIVFITVPQAKKKAEIEKYNAINDIIEKRGYPVLNLMDKTEDIGIAVEKDFYNTKHINIHGSLKYTYYISEYLIKNYGFKDKRNDEKYADWNDSFETYMKKADSAVMDFQLDSQYVYNSLSAPEKLKAELKDNEITISWNKVENADGYEIFEKKQANGKWVSIGETSELSFKDSDFKNKSKYFYRAVPFKESNGKKAYGDFSYKGVAVVTPK